MKNTTCKNCGADRGLHHYETGQCPVNGMEAPVNRKQDWQFTKYEIEDDRDSTITAQADEIAKLKAALKEISETTVTMGNPQSAFITWRKCAAIAHKALGLK